MKKKQKPNTQPQVAKPPAGEGTTEKDDTRRAKALILSALTAGGVFQMNTWQVQAHGNRSSHDAVSFQQPYFSPNDYVVMRAQFAAPDSNTTHELMQVTSSLSNAKKSGTADSADTAKLQERKTSLEDQLRANAAAMQPVRFVRQGDAAGAVASIEGQGVPDRVLDSYSWTLLDVAYLNDHNTTATLAPANVGQFESLAKPAMAYTDKVLSTLPSSNLSEQNKLTKAKCAGVLHNVASFLVLPDNPSESQIQLAKTAAERALQLRQELNEAPEIMRANWMLGTVYLKANQMDAAEKSFRTSLQQAKSLHDEPGTAWAEYSLSLAIHSSKPGEAKKLQGNARQIAMRLSGKDITMDFLRLEIQSHA